MKWIVLAGMLTGVVGLTLDTFQRRSWRTNDYTSYTDTWSTPGTWPPGIKLAAVGIVIWFSAMMILA